MALKHSTLVIFVVAVDAVCGALWWLQQATQPANHASADDENYTGDDSLAWGEEAIYLTKEGDDIVAHLLDACVPVGFGYVEVTAFWEDESKVVWYATADSSSEQASTITLFADNSGYTAVATPNMPSDLSILSVMWSRNNVVLATIQRDEDDEPLPYDGGVVGGMDDLDETNFMIGELYEPDRSELPAYNAQSRC